MRDWRASFFLCMLLLLVAMAIVRFRFEQPARLSPIERADVVVLQPGASPQPVLLFSADQRRLTVTSHARRDLLVCLRGDCRLVEEWLGK